MDQILVDPEKRWNMENQNERIKSKAKSKDFHTKAKKTFFEAIQS
ncbi:hypothetical protein QR98_0096750, partial [Sarcoptes scabiei]